MVREEARQATGDRSGVVSQMPLVRGVRNKPGGAPSPDSARTRPSLFSVPQWQRGFALLHRPALYAIAGPIVDGLDARLGRRGPEA